MLCLALQQCHLAAELVELAFGLRLLTGQLKFLELDRLPKSADLQLHQALRLLLRAPHLRDLLHHFSLVALLLSPQLG